jgi:hypothetical protein
LNKNARIQKTLLRRLKSKTTKFCVDSLKNASIHRKCVDSKQIKNYSCKSQYKNVGKGMELSVGPDVIKALQRTDLNADEKEQVEILKALLKEAGISLDGLDEQ